MSIFPGKGLYMSRKSGIIKKQVVWTKDGSYIVEPVNKEKREQWITCPRTQVDGEEDDSDYEPLPGSNAYANMDDNGLIVPCSSKLTAVRRKIRDNIEDDEVDYGFGNGNNGRIDEVTCSDGNGTQSGGGNGGGGGGSDGKGQKEEPGSAPSGSSFEPIAGPSGINLRASTSGEGLPSSYEDEDEGKRPRKKVCAQPIDYGYDDDEDDYLTDEGDFDEDTDPNNNGMYGQYVLPPPILHHNYVRSYQYLSDPSIVGISQADWNEAGPSGLNLGPVSSGVNVDVGPPALSIVTSDSCDMIADPPDSDPPSSTAAQQSSMPSTDSSLSSSCSHRSLVDRYTHMNISGCEDQTDEECAFSESDDNVCGLEEG